MALGNPIPGHSPIDRNRPTSLSPNMAPPLRQNRPRMGNAGSVADNVRVQRGNGALGLCACTAGRVLEFHCSIVCPLHGRGRHSRHGELARNAPGEHNTAGNRRGDGQYCRDNGCGDDFDPASYHSQRQPPSQRSHHHFLYHSRRQCRRSPHTFRRSTALCGVSARCGLLVDGSASLAPDTPRIRFWC